MANKVEELMTNLSMDGEYFAETKEKSELKKYARNINRHQLGQPNFEYDRFNLEAKLFDRVCICVIHDLCFFVVCAVILMVWFVVCVVLALGVLVDILNK